MTAVVEVTVFGFCLLNWVFQRLSVNIPMVSKCFLINLQAGTIG